MTRSTRGIDTGDLRPVDHEMVTRGNSATVKPSRNGREKRKIGIRATVFRQPTGPEKKSQGGWTASSILPETNSGQALRIYFLAVNTGTV